MLSMSSTATDLPEEFTITSEYIGHPRVVSWIPGCLKCIHVHVQRV